MAIVYIFLASIITAFANLFTRKSVDSNPNPTGDPFIPQRLFASAVIVIAVAFIESGQMVFEFKMGAIGVISGLLLGALMWTASKALQRGPSGLTNAVINSACMAPALILAMMFGEEFGHTYNVWNGLGAIGVMAGLFWMGWNTSTSKRSPDWIVWILAGLGVHIALLTFFQWKALLLKEGLPPSPFIPFQGDPVCSNCFTLMMFLTASVMQFFLPGPKTSLRPPTRALWLYGIVGGFVNGIGSVFTMLATEAATTELQKALLFPLYCVALITVCNLWASYLYHEKINWPANAVCYAGILISAL